MLAAIEHKFSVISITETCIRSADCDELNLPGCQFVTIYRNLLKQWENCRYLPLKSPLVFFCEPLLHIINLWLTSGIFPSKLKIAEVVLV